MNFSHAAGAEPRAGTAVRPSRQDGHQQPRALDVDLRAARRAGRSCCCSARPAVIAVMPPSSARPHQTDLLLCGHHYRLFQWTLAAAGGVAQILPGRRTADVSDIVLL